MAITLLLTGTLILSLFNFVHLNLNPEYGEIFVDISAIEEIIEPTEPEFNASSKSTNQAINKTVKYKHFSEAYKPIAPPKDYDDSKFKSRNDEPEELEEAKSNTENSSIDKEELTTYKSVNSILNKHSKNKQSEKAQAAANLNSSVQYSLKGRTDLNLDPPIYLCQVSGKIIVNITVNAAGDVTEAYINNQSTSQNECLRDHALEYAKTARFSSAKVDSQIGSITFNFRGKN